MSYFPKKGMRLNKEGVAVYEDPGTAPIPYATKGWWRVEVHRRLVDGKGETKARSKQVAAVFSTYEEAAGLGARRCPDPRMGDGDVRTSVRVRQLGSEEAI